jgi:hypothetical protein
VTSDLPRRLVPAGDDLLSRIERRTWLFTALAMLAAALLPRGGWWLSLSVGGGALLSLVSYWAIKRGIGGLADALLAGATGGETTGRPSRGLIWVLLRYALLAGMAYVMIARLRLSPIGLLCGVSMTVLAAAAEAVRRPR